MSEISVYSSFGFSNATEITAIVRNLVINGFDVNDIEINARILSDELNNINIQEATVVIKDKFVIFRTLKSNCSSVFIEKNTLDEFAFNALFRGGNFTIAFATENLFGKSVHIKDNIYLYRLTRKATFKYLEDELNFSRFQNPIPIIKQQNGFDLVYFNLVKIFSSSDCWFLFNIDYWTPMTRYYEIKDTNLFFVYYSSSSRFLKEFFKVAYKYRAYRTSSNLRVFIS